MFEGVVANTPELLRESYRLRYQVYCVEHQFLDPEKNPGGLERDEHDDHSAHAILRHRATGAVVGTVRLVLHRPGATSGSLPFHAVCKHPALRDPNFMPLEATAEFSRFAISKMFRRRIDDGTYCRGYDPKELFGDPRRVIPHITLGLMTMTLRLALPNNVRFVCAVMDPALLRLLSRFGIHFQLLGAQVDYHGWRQPCYAAVPTLLAGIEAERPDVWDVITDRGRLWKPSFKREIAANSGTILRV
jgi:N-acyl amino acid synthase of PEP-CTERM/exosortase system